MAPTTVEEQAVDLTPYTPALVTVPDVEILEVGEDWQTSTGVFTFDDEDLVSAIASQEDPAVRTPVLKLGHIDPREGFDGQPAFGKLMNLRLKNNGLTLVTDLVGVPQWLASVMWAAYPRRSIEGDFNIFTQTGNSWRFVLTGLALLGEAYPAITTLEDLKGLWGAEVPLLLPDGTVEARGEAPGTTNENGEPVGRFTAWKVAAVKWKKEKAEETHPEVAAAVATAVSSSEEQGTLSQDATVSLAKDSTVTPTEEVEATVAPRSNAVTASVSVDDIRRSYYDALSSAQMWWWVRQVLADPLQLVVDDDEGGLYLVDITVNGDEVTFGEPQPVKMEYVAAARQAIARPGQVVASRYDSPEASGARPRATEPKKESGEMKLTDESLAALGLEPGATDDEVNAAIAAMKQPVTPEEVAEPAEDAVVPEPENAEKATPAADVQVPEGMVLMDAETANEMRELVSAAREDRVRQEAEQRQRDITDAVMAGKIPRSRVEHYTKLYEADPEGTRTTLASLAPGIIPVVERGEAGETDPAVAEKNSYPAAWRNQVAASRRHSGTTRVKVVSDDV